MRNTKILVKDSPLQQMSNQQYRICESAGKIYDDEDLLTPEEVCKIIGNITTKTLRDWNNHHRHKKALAPIRITYRIVRYRYGNVKEFIRLCGAIY